MIARERGAPSEIKKMAVQLPLVSLTARSPASKRMSRKRDIREAAREGEGRVVQVDTAHNCLVPSTWSCSLDDLARLVAQVRVFLSPALLERRSLSPPFVAGGLVRLGAHELELPRPDRRLVLPADLGRARACPHTRTWTCACDTSIDDAELLALALARREDEVVVALAALDLVEPDRAAVLVALPPRRLERPAAHGAVVGLELSAAALERVRGEDRGEEERAFGRELGREPQRVGRVRAQREEDRAAGCRRRRLEEDGRVERVAVRVDEEVLDVVPVEVVVVAQAAEVGVVGVERTLGGLGQAWGARRAAAEDGRRRAVKVDEERLVEPDVAVLVGDALACRRRTPSETVQVRGREGGGRERGDAPMCGKLKTTLSNPAPSSSPRSSRSAPLPLPLPSPPHSRTSLYSSSLVASMPNKTVAPAARSASTCVARSGYFSAAVASVSKAVQHRRDGVTSGMGAIVGLSKDEEEEATAAAAAAAVECGRRSEWANEKLPASGSTERQPLVHRDM